jgi:hypothetical protein
MKEAKNAAEKAAKESLEPSPLTIHNAAVQLRMGNAFARMGN